MLPIIICFVYIWMWLNYYVCIYEQRASQVRFCSIINNINVCSSSTYVWSTYYVGEQDTNRYLHSMLNQVRFNKTEGKLYRKIIYKAKST